MSSLGLVCNDINFDGRANVTGRNTFVRGGRSLPGVEDSLCASRSERRWLAVACMR